MSDKKQRCYTKTYGSNGRGMDAVRADARAVGVATTWGWVEIKANKDGSAVEIMASEAIEIALGCANTCEIRGHRRHAENDYVRRDNVEDVEAPDEVMDRDRIRAAYNRIVNIAAEIANHGDYTKRASDRRLVYEKLRAAVAEIIAVVG